MDFSTATLTKSPENCTVCIKSYAAYNFLKGARETTAKQAESQKVYQQHRDRQRAAILDAARGLFIQKGIHETTLGEIATEAGVTRATIYQYFSNQADVAWAVLEEGFESIREGLWNTLHQGGTGYERIAAFLSNFLVNLVQRPEHFRFLAQFDYMYASSQDVDRLLTTVKRTLGGTLEPVAEVVRAGMTDGSLRANLNPMLTASALVNTAIAMAVRLEAHRTSVEIEYGYPPEQIFEEALQLLLQGICAT